MKQSRQLSVFMGRGLSLLLLVLMFGLFVSSCGAEEPKTYRVGVLIGLPAFSVIEEGFKDGMAELGYVEDENIVYDVHITDLNLDTYESILQQFVADEVDLILVFPTEATLLARDITADTDISVIFAGIVVDGTDLIENVQTPGGNLTGVRYPGATVALLRYELLRDILPDMDRIVIPYQAGYPIVPPQLAAIYPVAEADGVTIVELPANTSEELDTLLREQVEAGEGNVDAILGLIEPLVVNPNNFAVIADIAKEYQIPIGGAYGSTEDYAAVFGINIDQFVSGRLAAPLADKILQGAEAGTIPVVSADPYIEIDYKMAQELGIEISDVLLARASQVYR